MADISLKSLYENLVHIGQRAASWNPKMKPYLFGKKNGVHIFDLENTVESLEKAKKFLAAQKLQNKKALFVGTKPQIALVLQKQLDKKKFFYVDQKWQPGLLTNFKEIRRRIDYYSNLKSQFENGEINRYTKKEIAQKRKELEKLSALYHGVEEMRQKPAVVIVLDAVGDRLAINEATKAKVPVIAVCDSDANPDNIDIVIPGNDDSMKSIGFLLKNMVESLD